MADVDMMCGGRADLCGVSSAWHAGRRVIHYDTSEDYESWDKVKQLAWQHGNVQKWLKVRSTDPPPWFAAALKSVHRSLPTSYTNVNKVLTSLGLTLRVCTGWLQVRSCRL